MHTFSAGRAPVGGLGAVADVAAALLDAASPVVAQAAGAAAVTGAAGADAWRHPGPLLQVKVDAVDGERSDAAQEAPLPGGRSPCRKRPPLVIFKASVRSEQRSQSATEMKECTKINLTLPGCFSVLSLLQAVTERKYSLNLMTIPQGS